MSVLSDRATRLFLLLAAFFAVNAVLANLIGVKIFALEDTLGIAPLQWSLFGQSGSLSFTAGVIVWPLIFVLTDLVNEFYGKRGVRFISLLSVGLILYAFAFAYAAIALVPAEWWIGAGKTQGVPDQQAAFAAIFGQGLWSILGSTVAFLVGQLIDVAVFVRLRRMTGERWVWLRATGSTAVSQFIDSFVVLYIAFVIGPQAWPTSLWLAVGTVNYGYKLAAAVALIPLIYLARRAFTTWLGRERAEQLRLAAAQD